MKERQPFEDRLQLLAWVVVREGPCPDLLHYELQRLVIVRCQATECFPS